MARIVQRRVQEGTKSTNADHIIPTKKALKAKKVMDQLHSPWQASIGLEAERSTVRGKVKREKDGISWRRVNRVLGGCSWAGGPPVPLNLRDLLSETQEGFQQWREGERQKPDLRERRAAQFTKLLLRSSPFRAMDQKI